MRKRGKVSDQALVVIRKPDSLLVYFEPTVDPEAIEAAAQAQSGTAVDLDVDRPRRKVRIRPKGSRARACAEGIARTLGGHAPVIDMS